MHYIETTSILEIDEIEQKAPRNWIPERSWRKYKNPSEISPQNTEATLGRAEFARSCQNSLKSTWSLVLQTQVARSHAKNCRKRSNITIPGDKEGFDTDFLISPGDMYPDRKVKLEDAEITMETRKAV